MKKISIRDFQLKPTKYLKELPIVLTHYGKLIASVIPFDESVNTLAPKRVLKQKSVNTFFDRLSKEAPGLCKHGAMIGLCRFGCKKKNA